jgi:short-subunit dehydrogenase
MAERFAAAGYHLLLCARDPVKLSEATDQLQQRYPAVIIRSKATDVGNKEEVLGLAGWILDGGTTIDVLVNNAGEFIPGNVHDEDEGVLERLMTVNLYSAYHLTRQLLPAMMTRRSGHIFNICSVASLQAYPRGGGYSISKYALAGFSANLRQEMKEYGIKVTTVFPGAAFTDSWAGSGVDPQRIMKAEDVAEMVYSASQLSPQATVEEILLRPQLGDL